MKNVLLTTTALVFTAGFAAAEINISATAKLTYGNYGTGHHRSDEPASSTGPSVLPAGEDSFSQEVDVDFGLSGEASGIAYSVSAGLGEDGAVSLGVMSMSAAGVTVAYGDNEFGGLTSAGADGEDDDEGDLKISYANAGITASYERDDANGDYIANVGYTAGALTLGLETKENNNDDGGDATNKVSIGYTMGDIAVAVSANNDNDWDASLAYTTGDATVTFATDEQEAHSIAVATTMNGLSLAAKYTAEDKDNADAVTELSAGYTMGDVSVAVAYDSAQADHYGDEAETTLVIGYDLGAIALEFKANNQDEMEASAAFTF